MDDWQMWKKNQLKIPTKNKTIPNSGRRKN